MPDLPDALVLNTDGTVDLTFAGKMRHLRRPLFGEFRDLRVQLYETQDAALMVTRGMTAELTRPDGLTDEAWQAQAGEHAVEAQRKIRAATSEMEDRNLGLIRGAVELLSGEPLPADAQLPVWLAEPSLIAQLMTHWRSVPLSPGVR